MFVVLCVDRLNVGLEEGGSVRVVAVGIWSLCRVRRHLSEEGGRCVVVACRSARLRRSLSVMDVALVTC